METNNEKLTELSGELGKAASEHVKASKSLIDIRKLETNILKKIEGATDEQIDVFMLDITNLKNSLIEIAIQLKNEKYSYKILDELIKINKTQIESLHLLLRENLSLIQQLKKDNSENKYLEAHIDYDFIKEKSKAVILKEVSVAQEIYNLLEINQEEVLLSPLRFNGVNIEKIKKIFAQNGVNTESKF